MKPAYYIIAGLLILIVVHECTRPNRPLPPSIQAHTDSILVKRDRVASLDKAGQSIARKMALDSARFATELLSRQNRIDLLEAKIKAIRAPKYTSPEIDSIISVLYP